jgi:hypothetical protein
VSQISPPIRILLVVAVAFLGVYMVALRPKAAPAPAQAPAAPAGNVNTGKPAVTGFGKAVESAKGAAAATEKHLRSVGAEGVGSAHRGAARPAAGTAAGAPATGAAKAGSSRAAVALPLPVLKAIAKHKVLALLFWNPRSADDRRVRAALRKVDTFRGQVFVLSAPIRTISRYGRITRGADVQQSPTVVVVDRKLRATTLVGYVDALTIQQAIVDAMRASGGVFLDRYLAKLNSSCSATIRESFAVPQAMTPAQAPGALRGRVARFDGFVADVRSTPAPARWRGLKKTILADATALQAVFHKQQRALGSHPTAARVATVSAALRRESAPLSRRFNRHLDAQHLVFCGSHG